MADAVSRLHRALKCLEFKEQLCSQTPDQWWMESCYPLTCLLTVTYTSVADCLNPEMTKNICRMRYSTRDHIRFYKTSTLLIALTGTATFAFVSTWNTLVPAQAAHICQYVAFSPTTLQATSIPNCFNIISILHKEFNLPNPLANNWALQSLLTGIKRVKGQPPA